MTGTDSPQQLLHIWREFQLPLTNAHQGVQNGRSESGAHQSRSPFGMISEHNDRFNVCACFDCSFILSGSAFLGGMQATLYLTQHRFGDDIRKLEPGRLLPLGSHFVYTNNMARQTKAVHKKSRGRPTGQRYSETIPARLEPETVAAVEKWAAASDVSRSEAIRRLVELGLTVKTQAPPRKAKVLGRARNNAPAI